MLKYYKEYLSDYQFADIFQTLILLASVLFFAALVYSVLNKPKDHYKETSELPLEDEDPLF